MKKKIYTIYIMILVYLIIRYNLIQSKLLKSCLLGKSKNRIEQNKFSFEIEINKLVKNKRYYSSNINQIIDDEKWLISQIDYLKEKLNNTNKNDDAYQILLKNIKLLKSDFNKIYKYFPHCIYMIMNKIDKKVYIGQTSNIINRLNQHNSTFKSDDYILDILYIAKHTTDINTILKKETELMFKYKSFVDQNGYNKIPSYDFKVEK